jgi:hypothetical protein
MKKHEIATIADVESLASHTDASLMVNIRRLSSMRNVSATNNLLSVVLSSRISLFPS